MTCSEYYRFFETIAHKSRWRILELLASGPKTVSEICEELGEEQSKVSHNLRKLAECNVLSVEQIGKHRRYSLNERTILPLMEIVREHVERFCKYGCNREKIARERQIVGCRK